MKNNTPILIGAVVLFLILAGVGAYAFLNGDGSGLNGGNNGSGGNPASIKVLRLEKPNLVIQGENLGKVEVWALQSGQERLLGSALKQGGPSDLGAGETWLFPIPSGVAGSSGIFARGYDSAGKVVARMDLPPEDLSNL